MRACVIGLSCVLVEGDCRLLDLSSVPPFDSVVSDPPYGIAHYKGSTGRLEGSRGTSKIDRHTERIIDDETKFDPAFSMSLSDNVALFGADHFATKLSETGRWLAWDKLSGLDSWDSFSDVEFVWHSRPGKSEVISYLWKGIVRARVGEDARTSHKSQKPIRVMEWLLDRVGAGSVMDPYMGSGTTGVACARFGLPFVGVEVVTERFETSVRRLTEAHECEPLWFEAAERDTLWTPS